MQRLEETASKDVCQKVYGIPSGIVCKLFIFFVCISFQYLSVYI